jgi:hypothetical protein
MKAKLRSVVMAVLAVGVMALPSVVHAQGCGEVWTPVELPENGTEFYTGLWANGLLVAGGCGAVMTSTDGRTWSFDAGGNFGWVTGVAYGAGRYVAALATEGAILLSKDGHNWNRHRLESGGWFQDVTFAKGLFVAASLHGHIWTSPDGLNWTRHVTGYKKWFTSVTYGHGRFVAVGVGGIIATSPDGLNWYRQTPRNVGRVVADGLGPRVTSGPDGFVMVYDFVILTSPDGKTWTPRFYTDSEYLEAVIYNGSVYVAVGDMILTSPDGVTWTRQEAPATRMLYGVVSDGNKTFALGGNFDGAAILESSCDP